MYAFFKILKIIMCRKNKCNILIYRLLCGNEGAKM